MIPYRIRLFGRAKPFARLLCQPQACLQPQSRGPGLHSAISLSIGICAPHIGSEANETIIDKTQGHSLIVTGDGTDIVSAGRGNDVVVSSGGGDHLDGGEGNDWLIAKNGSNAITAGGLGRDLIFNQTVGGVVWGDVENSVRLTDGRRSYFLDGVQYFIEDSAENSDRILYAPDVTVMDAQHHDILTFYGMPLTGGDAAASNDNQSAERLAA